MMMMMMMMICLEAIKYFCIHLTLNLIFFFKKNIIFKKFKFNYLKSNLNIFYKSKQKKERLRNERLKDWCESRFDSPTQDFEGIWRRNFTKEFHFGAYIKMSKEFFFLFLEAFSFSKDKNRKVENGWAGGREE